MTVLSCVQDACTRLGIEVPSQIFGDDTRTAEEFRYIVQDAAREIAEAHDWQLLTSVVSGGDIPTGDGSTESFDLPTNFDRFDYETNFWSSSLETPLTHIADRDRWLEIDIKSFDFVINAWTVYGGQLHIKPAMGSGVTAKYWWVTDQIIMDTDGVTTKAEFDNDNDTFRIDERLLTKCIIWMWKQSKGIAYAEEMNSYNRLLQKRIKWDGPSRKLRTGRSRLKGNLKVAYPTTISG